MIFGSAKVNALCAAAFLCAAGWSADFVLAGERFSIVPDTAAPRRLVAFADERRWTAELLGTALGDLSNRQVIMGGLSIGAGYYVFDNLAIMLDVSGYGFNQGDENGSAVGATLGLRHHLFKVKQASIFVDVSGGVIETSRAVPHRGTHFNNTFEVGPGIAFPLRDNFYLIGGVRYFHLSNAESHGSNRNPSVNAVQGVFGVAWRF